TKSGSVKANVDIKALSVQAFNLNGPGIVALEDRGIYAHDYTIDGLESQFFGLDHGDDLAASKLRLLRGLVHKLLVKKNPASSSSSAIVEGLNGAAILS